MGLFGRKKQRPVEDEVDSVDAAVEEAPRRGPKDAAEVPGQEGRLDLGSIWLRGVPGMELRLEVDEPRQKVIGAQLVLGDSQMQVQAFAAPRSLGIWDEIRDEIAQSVATGGGTAEEADGPLGTELHARMPTRAQSGRTVFSPVRFVGVDGPRWFFRAVVSGRAAVDAQAVEEFYALLDHVVVVRGDVPMAPREVLELQLPKNAGQSGPPAGGADMADDVDGDEGESADVGGTDTADNAHTVDNAANAAHSEAAADDLSPFERGPEITETR